MIPSVFALSLGLCGLGCGSGGGFTEPASVSGISGGSSYAPSSSILSSYSGGSGSELSMPQRGAARADLVVRPDTVVIGFALKETHADAEAALVGLAGAAADLEKRLKEATAGAASVKMGGATMREEPKGKADDGERGEVAVVVDGAIEVGLAPGLDFWARSRLLASLARVTRGVASAFKGSKPERAARFSEPSVIVKDPEVYRAKLTEAWVKRARAFADAAQAGAAPLYLVDCAPPARIEQQAISLEEVGLSLPMTCKLNALGAPKEH